MSEPASSEAPDTQEVKKWLEETSVLAGQAEGSAWGVTLQVVTAEQESDWICLVFLKAV